MIRILVMTNAGPYGNAAMPYTTMYRFIYAINPKHIDIFYIEGFVYAFKAMCVL